MKILFLMRHSGYIRNYKIAIQQFLNHGHDVRFGFVDPPNPAKVKGGEVVYKLADENPGVSFYTIRRDNSIITKFLELVRSSIDYIKYLDPIYANSPKLVERGAKKVPPLFRNILRAIIPRNEVAVRLTISVFGLIDMFVPPSRRVKGEISQYYPDIILLTPMLDSWQMLIEHVKSAKRLGITTVLCVASWDNLTNKGFIQIKPNKVVVWNEFQKKEAIQMHRVPAEDVVITGAQLFDEWFKKQPSLSKKEFHAKVGFDSDQEYMLYLCSSGFISKSKEADFVKKIILATRTSSDPAMRDIPVLIRPHPNNIKQWLESDFSKLRNVSIWPKLGDIPMFEVSKQNYFDSLYHCKFAVGINTSAMIEAGILGKPVFTILSGEFEETQRGTLHFRHLVDGGLLHVFNGIDDYVSGLSSVITGSESAKNRREEFIKRFVRPMGKNIDATDIFVKEIESLFYV